MTGLQFKSLKLPEVAQENGISTFATIKAKKKCRSNVKALNELQHLGTTQKRLTPWLSNSMHANTE